LGGFILWHYCNFPLGGGIAVVSLIGVFITLVSKSNIIMAILSFMGNMSLESYLTNIYLGHIIMKSDVITLSGGVKAIIVIVVGLFTAYIFHELSNKIISKIE
jgi:peptidoglycan/LPS O-acetylase OafA/YrhL